MLVDCLLCRDDVECDKAMPQKMLQIGLAMKTLRDTILRVLSLMTRRADAATACVFVCVCACACVRACVRVCVCVCVCVLPGTNRLPARGSSAVWVVLSLKLLPEKKCVCVCVCVCDVRLCVRVRVRAHACGAGCAL
jgi:hypothetical protein